MQSKTITHRLLFKLAINLFGINCIFLAAFYLAFNDSIAMRTINNEANYRMLLIIVNLLTVVINLFPTGAVRKEFRDFALFAIGYMAVIVFLQGYEFSRAFHIYFLVQVLIFTLLLRFSNLAGRLERLLFPNLRPHKVLLIADVFDNSISQYVDSRPENYKFIGLLSDKPQFEAGNDDLFKGDINYLEQLMDNDHIDEVLISTSSLPTERIDHIMKVAEKYHATVSVLPPYFQFLSSQSFQTEYWMGVPVISFIHTKLSIKFYRIIKRLLDITISLIFLVIIFPVLCLAVVPAIMFSGRGPIFFKQLRKGYKQKPFLCYKFRTMKLDCEIDETVQAMRTDPRITQIGKSLRKTSLDEVPQFLNVLFGNMSIVGPRPHMVEHDDMYEKVITRYNVRFVAKPGITGWAQINGFRGGTEDHTLMEKRIEHDLWYIKHWSVWLDIKIICLTSIKMLKGDNNAY